MSTDGYLYLYRCIKDSWQWKNPAWRAAWLWLLVEARYSDGNGLKRGQVKGSLSFFAKAWGMKVHQVRYFLELCVKEGDIEWLKSRGGGHHRASRTAFRTACLTVNSTVNSTVLSVITLVNYERYQDSRLVSSTVNSTVNSTGCHTAILTNQKKGTEEKKEVNNTARKKRASHDREVLQGLLSEINMPEFERTYGPQGLDTFACFDNFTDYMLNGSAKDPRPNPSNYVAPLSRAFHDKCKRDLSKGYFLKKAGTSKPLSLAERLAQRDKGI